MIQDFHRMISAALGISERQISQTLGLLEDGATIPFISRYRKEATGGLDEVQIEAILLFRLLLVDGKGKYL